MCVCVRVRVCVYMCVCVRVSPAIMSNTCDQRTCVGVYACVCVCINVGVCVLVVCERVYVCARIRVREKDERCCIDLAIWGGSGQ